MLRITALWSLLLLYPSLCLAEPIYLDCNVSSGTEQKMFSVKLDEPSGKITHTHNDGSAFNADGVFGAKSITYQQIDIFSIIKITFRYEIDRTDLKATQVFLVEPTNPEYAAKIPAKTTTMIGSCSIVKVSGRKI